jgi:hypothetical protein
MTGESLKTAGMQTALDHAGEKWTASTLDKLRAFCKARKDMGAPAFRFEEFVSVAKDRGWPMPPSSNAFGALPRLAVRAGLIRFTGQYENAKSPKTRCHPVKIWMAV